MATHTQRTQHQLGDFLFGPDLVKLRMGRPISQFRPPEGTKLKSNMNTLREDELITNILRLDNSPGNSTHSKEGVTNLNYVKNKNSSKKECKKDRVDNEKFQATGKSRRSSSKSPKSKTRKTFQQKEMVQNEEIKVIAMDLDEDTEEDKKRSLNLEKEIEAEQEYQNQINMIYNNPCYFDQYSSDLQYQAELHHTLQDQFILDPHIMLQNPPMYYIAAPPPHFENQVLFFQSDDGSCDLSDCRSSTPASSETSEDESSQECSNLYYNEHPENTLPFELDEELNNLVLSIITD